jgi:chaperonin cofactor prefoldin
MFSIIKGNKEKRIEALEEIIEILRKQVSNLEEEVESLKTRIKRKECRHEEYDYIYEFPFGLDIRFKKVCKKVCKNCGKVVIFGSEREWLEDKIKDAQDKIKDAQEKLEILEKEN